MKRNLLYFLAAVLAVTGTLSCEQDIGFLDVDGNAGYTSPYFTIYVDPPASSPQALYNQPYFTTAVEGVQGTYPLHYSLYSVTSQDGNVKAMTDQMFVQPGIGKIIIPPDHTIPVGSYTISIMVTNDYGSLILDEVVTIQVI